MMDLTFNNSLAGSLAEAGRIGKKPLDVAPLTLALDVGDLSQMAGDVSRRSVMELMYGDFPDALRDICDLNGKAMSLIEQAKAASTPIRMWVSASDANDLCGLFFMCYMMPKDHPLYVVWLPEMCEKGGQIVSHYGTGDYTPAELVELLGMEKPIIPALKGLFSARWRELAQGGSSLRAVINGRVMGVPEDFYDFALRENMPEGKFVIAWLIGETLGKLRCISDRWLFLRVMHMMDTGELKQIAPPKGDHPYSGTAIYNSAGMKAKTPADLL